MANQNEKRLTLKRTTLRNLTPHELAAAIGGVSPTMQCDDLNPQPLPP